MMVIQMDAMVARHAIGFTAHSGVTSFTLGK